jgi:hypothetical protein
LNEARRITDSVIDLRNSTILDKISGIGGFIHNRFKGQTGKPSNELLNASPLNQYKMLCASDSMQLWCGNFAEIFSFFCWSQGIATRNIEILNPIDHHVLNECYIPALHQWVMVDPTNNLLLVSNEQNVYLNLQTFKGSIKKTQPLTWQVVGDSVRQNKIDMNASYIRNYYSMDYPSYYYHRIDNQKAYATSNKIKQYFLPVSWYDIYDNKAKGNAAFYLKLVFILFWLISFFVFILSRTKFRT